MYGNYAWRIRVGSLFPLARVMRRKSVAIPFEWQKGWHGGKARAEVLSTPFAYRTRRFWLVSIN